MAQRSFSASRTVRNFTIEKPEVATIAKVAEWTKHDVINKEHDITFLLHPSAVAPRTLLRIGRFLYGNMIFSDTWQATR
jgi:hypothetical protein